MVGAWASKVSTGDFCARLSRAALFDPRDHAKKRPQKALRLLGSYISAGGGGRTHTVSPPTDFELGYKIYATRNTAKALNENGVNAIRTNKIEQPSPNLMDLILGHKIDLVIDTPSQGVEHSKDGFVIRRNAIETGVNVLTSLDTATALVTSLENTDVKKLTLIDIATIDKR